jgi:hypothetical protein
MCSTDDKEYDISMINFFFMHTWTSAHYFPFGGLHVILTKCLEAMCINTIPKWKEVIYLLGFANKKSIITQIDHI